MKTVEAIAECSMCGTRYPFLRKKNKQKVAGHIKHLWCRECRMITAHVEIKSE